MGLGRRLATIPGAFHDTTFQTAPELYQESVLSFLDSNFTK